MIPLNDNNPTKITPYVTYTLIAINILVFIYQLSLSPQELTQFFQNYALVPRRLTEGFTSSELALIVPPVLTLFTSQFLHGGFLHIGGNMLYLWIFGNNIEEQLGRFRYIIFYLICGALAALAQWFFSMQSTVPALGASGAIAGVMGAYIIKFPKARILALVPIGFFLTTFRIPAIVFLGFWFVMQAFYGIAGLQAPSDVGAGGVAYWAHAGGFVFGVILGPLLGLFSNSNRRRNY
ncbi:rhomboid family intramembrane serine protease [Pleurocapsales cyanobacterium LEGE 06147]|nr:rhomboid family intramembrane serine protease [Pleurocapsales cyanobacterium LEGE 06147]